MNQYFNKSMNKSVKIAIIIAAIVIIWIMSGQFGQSYDKDTSTESSYTQDSKDEKLQVRVERRVSVYKTSELSILGITKAARTVNLKSQTNAVIENINVSKGSFVKKGDLLFKLEIKDRYAKLNQAKALLTQTELELNAAQKLSQQGFRAKTKLAEAEALYEQAKASVEAIELDIKNTEIRAPIEGILDTKNVNVGDLVDIGDPVGSLVDLSYILVSGSVSERNISDIKIGTHGRVRIFNGDEYDGTVTYKSRVADPKTRTFEIELKIENPDANIAQGMTAELTIPLASKKAHFVSPAVLTLSDDGIMGIKTVDESNIVTFQPVNILDHTHKGIWLTGLSDQINLITVGQEFVVDGQEVIPVYFGEESENNS